MAIVVERRGHAYDIGQRFVRRFGGVLSPRVQSAYDSLGTLHEKGLVDCYESAGQRATDRWRKLVYEANRQGTDAHRAWMDAPIAPRNADRELWMRMLALQRGEYATLLTLFDRYEEALLESPRLQVHDPLCDPLLGELAIEDHERWLQSRIAWLERAREKAHHRIDGHLGR